MKKEFETTDHKYVRKSKLGEGGPSVVFLVENEGREKYALKVLKPDVLRVEQSRRFRNEINFCEKFDHKNVIKVLDKGFYYEDNDRKVHYYVMPYYPYTLRKLIKDSIANDDILPIFSGILAGVNAAHLCGHFHRDLKPENILLTDDKNPVIADFGAAHFHRDSLLTIVETKPTSRLANFRYAAPEQRLEGETVDHRADIYALGLILNEMFTGKVPFAEGYRKIGEVSSPHGYLDEIVVEMIQQNPENRPHSLDNINVQLRVKHKEYFGQQRIDALKNKVVPLAELGDEITFEPVSVVDFDFKDDNFEFYLNKSVNKKWIEQFQKIDDRANGLYHAWPEQMKIDSNVIRVSCVGDESLKRSGQAIADNVKRYVAITNDRYATVLKREREEEEQRLIRNHNSEKLQITAQIRKEEERQRILNEIKL